MLPEFTNLSSAANRTPSPGTVHLFGNLLTFRARGADTQGIFSLLDCYSAPGQGAPAHRHEEAEAFFILDGAFEISADGRSRIYQQSVTCLCRLKLGPFFSKCRHYAWAAADHYRSRWFARRLLRRRR